MRNWKRVKLGEVAQLIMGQSPDSKYYNTDGIGIKFLQGCAEFGNKYPNATVYCSQPKKVAPKNSILFSVRAPVGKINFADDVYCIGRGLASIIPQNIDLHLVYQYLEFIKDQYQNIAQGSTFEAVNSEELKSLELFIPQSKSEQTRMATILSQIDQAIEQTEQIIAKYQRIKTGLMQDLLTRGIDEQGNIRSEETHEFKDSSLGRIPKEWKVGEVGDLCYVTKLAGFEFTKYVKYTEDGEIIALRALNIKNEKLDLSDVQRITRSVSDILPRSKVFKNDVLITYIGAYIGDVLLIKDNNKYHLAPNVAKIVAGEKLYPKYLELALRHHSTQAQIKNLTTTTATPSLTMKQIRNLQIIYPLDKSEQERIIDVYNMIASNLENKRKQLSKLQKIKTGLMQDLLTGKVRVNYKD